MPEGPTDRQSYGSPISHVCSTVVPPQSAAHPSRNPPRTTPPRAGPPSVRGEYVAGRSGHRGEGQPRLQAPLAAETVFGTYVFGVKWEGEVVGKPWRPVGEKCLGRVVFSFPHLSGEGCWIVHLRTVVTRKFSWEAAKPCTCPFWGGGVFPKLSGCIKKWTCTRQWNWYPPTHCTNYVEGMKWSCSGGLGTRSYQGLLALLLGARTLLGAPGSTTSSILTTNKTSFGP